MRYLAINGHRSKVPFSTWNFLEHHQNSFLGPSWDLYGAIKISGFQSSPKKSLNRHYIGRASKFRVSKQSLLLAQITVYRWHTIKCQICQTNWYDWLTHFIRSSSRYTLLQAAPLRAFFKAFFYTSQAYNPGSEDPHPLTNPARSKASWGRLRRHPPCQKNRKMKI